MTKEALNEALAPVLAVLAAVDPNDAGAKAALDAALPLDGPALRRLRQLVRAGVEARWRTRFVVDASGRDTFLAARMRHKERDPQHSSAAVFAHFKFVDRRPGADAGNGCGVQQAERDTVIGTGPWREAPRGC